MNDFSEIKHLINDNRVDHAITLLSHIICDNPDCEEAYILRGNAYRKLENWRGALSDYATARQLNPDGVGAMAYDAVIEILNFYNTDLYNP